MRLLIKNEFFSFEGASVVYNENGAPIYKVCGQVNDPCNTKTICDYYDGYYFQVKRRPTLNGPSEVIIDTNGNIVGNVLINYSSYRSYYVTGMRDQYEIIGDGTGMGYTITRNNEAIGYINRPAVQVVDTFDVDFTDQINPAFIVALIIAVDCIEDDLKPKTSSMHHHHHHF